MKIEIELRTQMSRGDTFRALQIVYEAAQRLAHKFTHRELSQLSRFGQTLMTIAERERAYRADPEGADDTDIAPPVRKRDKQHRRRMKQLITLEDRS